jgi:hypothetical protein
MNAVKEQPETALTLPSSIAIHSSGPIDKETIVLVRGLDKTGLIGLIRLLIALCFLQHCIGLQLGIKCMQLARIGGCAFYCLTTNEVIILYTEPIHAAKYCQPNKFGITLGQELFQHVIIAKFQLIYLHLGPWGR